MIEQTIEAIVSPDSPHLKSSTQPSIERKRWGISYQL